MFLPSVPLSDILPRGSNNFDLLRTLAAASVIVSHAYLIVYGTTAAEPLASVSAYTLGQHAVNVFFILSGLLVAASLDRSRDIATFVIARILRIFPGLIVCVVLVAFVVGPLVTSAGVLGYLTSAQLPEYLLKTTSLSTALAPLPGLFETLPMSGQVNAPLWSLKYEVLCYTALTLIAVFGIWRKAFAFWGFFIALLGLHLIFEVGHSGVDEHVAIDQLLRFALCFFLGVAAYRLRHRLHVSMLGAVGAILLLLVTRQSALDETVGYFTVGYLTLCLAALPCGRIREIFSEFDPSYGLYVYGWPIAQTVLFFTPGIDPLLLAIESVVIAFFVGSMSWMLIEKPALRLKPRLASVLPAPGMLQYATRGGSVRG